MMPKSLKILTVLKTSSDSNRFDIFVFPTDKAPKIRALWDIDLSPDIFREPFNFNTFYIVN